MLVGHVPISLFVLQAAELLKSFQLHVIKQLDVATVCFEDPARILDLANREIWSPRWSSDGFSKDRDQIGFTTLDPEAGQLYGRPLFFYPCGRHSVFLGAETK